MKNNVENKKFQKLKDFHYRIINDLSYIHN